MDVFKCKICGGTLEINENESVATCEYCNTKQPLPDFKDVKSEKKSKTKVAKSINNIIFKFFSNIKALAKKWKLVDKKKKQKTFALITGALCGLLVLFVVGMQIANNYIIPNNKYEKAISLYNEKRYEEAELLFNEIPQFKNANEYSDKCVTNIVKNSTVVEFLHKQDAQISYEEFVKLYGNLLKEEIRYSTAYVMPSQWRPQGKLDFSGIAKYSTGDTELISAVFFWGTEKIPKEKTYLLGQQAYIGGRFNGKPSFTIPSENVAIQRNKNITLLTNLYFRMKKEVSKNHFEELVSYISTYEGKHTCIEYSDDKYESKWINDKCEYTLTYTIKENELQYSKDFK